MPDGHVVVGAVVSLPWRLVLGGPPFASAGARPVPAPTARRAIAIVRTGFEARCLMTRLTFSRSLRAPGGRRAAASGVPPPGMAAVGRGRGSVLVHAAGLSTLLSADWAADRTRIPTPGGPRGDRRARRSDYRATRPAALVASV